MIYVNIMHPLMDNYQNTLVLTVRKFIQNIAHFYHMFDRIEQNWNFAAIFVGNGFQRVKRKRLIGLDMEMRGLLVVQPVEKGWCFFLATFTSWQVTLSYRFRLQSAMLIHARCHLPAELKNRHQCDQCPKRFGTKPNLMAHKRIHAGVRDYTCDQCGKSFVQKGNLDNHLLTHTAARPYVCSTCGKAFKTLVRLRKHGSVHSGKVIFVGFQHTLWKSQL